MFFLFYLTMKSCKEKKIIVGEHDCALTGMSLNDYRGRTVV